MTATYDEVLLSLGLEPSGRSGRCGTYPGYAWHRNHGEEPCEPCRAANAEYKRSRLHALKDPEALPPIEHGTVKGARQHWYRGQKPCPECRTAYNMARIPGYRDYDRNRRRRTGGAS